MVKRLVTIMTLCSCFSTPLLAQSPAAGSPTSAPPATQQSQAASSLAQSLGMFAYPKKQQTAVALLLPRISAYPASTRNKIDPDPVSSLMRAEAPRCAVVCGISCIRPWAPFNDTAFPMPYDGGLFECLRSGPVTPYPSGTPSNLPLHAVQGRELGLPTLLQHAGGNHVTPREAAIAR
jgi:hypothetical protein